MPDGYFFDVMTNGFGAMPTYAPQVPARDRWAIVAYIRALQLSQHATLADVPADERAKLGSARHERPARCRRPSPCQPDHVLRSQSERALLGARRARPGGAAAPAASSTREQFFRSYLVAYLFLVGIALGSLGLVMLNHITGGALGRRDPPRLRVGDAHAAAAGRALPADRCSASHDLYEWARAGARRPRRDPAAQGGLYLNVPFFLVRAVLYFADLARASACFLLRWSLEQDATGDPRRRAPRCRCSAAAARCSTR